MLKLEDISAFLKVAEVGGFSRAASALCISKSAVSAKVARLEAEVGATLIARTTRGVSLTDAGARFKSRCAAAMDELELAREELRDCDQEPSGTLRLTAPLAFGLSCIAGVLDDFMHLHAHLRCEVDYSDECHDLAAGRFDLALRLGRPAARSPKHQVIRMVRNLVVASPALIARVGEPAHPNDLRSMPCLTYSGDVDMCVWHMMVHDRLIGIHVKGPIRSNSMEALKLSAVAGHGYALMPMFLIEHELRANLLQQVLKSYEVTNVVICALYPPGSKISKNSQAFVNYLVKRLAIQNSEGFGLFCDPSEASLAA